MMRRISFNAVIAVGYMVGLTLVCSPLPAAPPGARTTKELFADYHKSKEKLVAERRKLAKLRVSRYEFELWVYRWNSGVARSWKSQYDRFRGELKKATTLRNPPKEEIVGEVHTRTSTTRFRGKSDNAAAKVIGQFLGDIVEVNARKQLYAWEQQMRGNVQLVQKRWSLYLQAETKVRIGLAKMEKDHKRLRLKLHLARRAEMRLARRAEKNIGQ